MTDVPEAPEPGPDDVALVPDETPAPTRRGFVARARELAGRVPIPRPRTKVGALALILGAAVVGVAFTLAGTELVHYSESTAFCTLCHTMEPQKKSAAVSPHAEVACGECHVTPTVAGFIKAKLDGTRELRNLVFNTYPMPIPPIEHRLMPDTKDTCQACHPISGLGGNTGPNRLVLRTTFAEDEGNTRRDLAVLMRPAKAGTPEAVGYHWHVETPVTFSTSDPHEQSIDTVEYTDPRTGELKRYIAVAKLRDSANAGADIDRLKQVGEVGTVSCLTCHNRVGHDIATADAAVDKALATGTLDPTLPYLKKNAIALLGGTYASTADGNKAIDGLKDTYKADFPVIAEEKAQRIDEASAELKKLFAELATPGMKTGPGTYPNNLGHQSGQGCFRCHDGAHYEVVDKVVTTKTIPSTCDTCHTFPQQTGPGLPPPAQKISAVMDPVPVGTRPADHLAALFVFTHKDQVTSKTSTGTSCAACHQPSYCESCHDSGAINVDHDQMLYNHAESARVSGGTTSCAVCHQPAYCDQCHKGDILGPSNSRIAGPKG